MNGQLEDLPVEVQAGDLITRYTEWGDMAIRYLKVPADTDMGPVLQGLPDDRCPSPHWGVVLEGAIRIVHGDGSEETARAGDAYHWPAGHTGTAEQDTVFIEVGPTAQMRQFSEHARAKLG